MRDGMVAVFLDHMEARLEGEGFFLKLTLTNGRQVSGAAYAPTSTYIHLEVPDEHGDRQPVFVSLAHIVSVEADI